MGGFCLLLELHWEGTALQPAQQACFINNCGLYAAVVSHSWPEGQTFTQNLKFITRHFIKISSPLLSKTLVFHKKLLSPKNIVLFKCLFEHLLKHKWVLIYWFVWLLFMFLFYCNGVLILFLLSWNTCTCSGLLIKFSYPGAV